MPGFFVLTRRPGVLTYIRMSRASRQRRPLASSVYGRNGDTTTYLDADGNPTDTTRGYAIVKKDGNKTLYYDKNGEPVTVGRGQYDVEKDEDGQSIYLDEEGVRMFRIDNFLHTHPFIVVLLGIAATVAAVMVRKKAWIIFLICILRRSPATGAFSSGRPVVMKCVRFVTDP